MTELHPSHQVAGDDQSYVWPRLSLPEWQDTYATLHMWLQVVGKIRLKQAPWSNHSWHSTLYVTARGLTTLPMAMGTRVFEMSFDFLQHRLLIETANGEQAFVPLEPQSVAIFYRRLMGALNALGLAVHIHPFPNEVDEPIPFEQDERHHTYERDHATRFWRALVQADRVFKMFRGRFVGKASPVHFFWGAPDLAVTRFSGRPAPEHPGGVPHLPDDVTREAYSQEVSSCGFWAGAPGVSDAAFYSYAYPAPAGFADASVRPAAAYWHSELREFLLPYAHVAASPDPDATLLEFLETTYAAAADLGDWDRARLERADGR